jgi:hypothetical protein
MIDDHVYDGWNGEPCVQCNQPKRDHLRLASWRCVCGFYTEVRRS